MDAVAKEVKLVSTEILVLKFHVVFVKPEQGMKRRKVNKHAVVTSANKSPELNECMKYKNAYITYIYLYHYLTLHERTAQMLLTNSLSSVASDMLSEPTANALCSVCREKSKKIS